MKSKTGSREENISPKLSKDTFCLWKWHLMIKRSKFRKYIYAISGLRRTPQRRRGLTPADTITPFIALSGGDHPAPAWSVAELTISWALLLYFSSYLVYQYHPTITLKCFSVVSSTNSSSALHSHTEFT